MRVGVIRGDLPGPIFLADLEPTSQANFPTEPPGQTRYLSRPTDLTVGPVLGTLSATIASTGAITFPLTINAGNKTLRIREGASDSWTVVTVGEAVYANVTTFVAALNTALGTSGFTAIAKSSTRIALLSVTKGAGARVQVDTVAAGSTLNTPAVLGAGGATFTMPSAATLIATALPVGGPLDVSAATLRTVLGQGLTDAQVNLVADTLAPRFVETDTALKSFLVGDLSELLSASYNPDPHRMPPIASGPAVTVVTDDGSTVFTSTVPTLTNAQTNTPVAGALTLTGTGLASSGSPNAEVVATAVKFYLPVPKSLSQAAIVAAGGTVSKTSIVVPASLVPSGTAAGTEVQVQYTSLVSNRFALV